MSVAVKYDLAATLVKVMTNPAEAIEELTNLASKLAADVAEMDKATTDDTGEKVNALESKYGKDEDGAKSAESFLRADDGVFDSIVDYINEDPGRTFHVLNAVQDLLVKYLRNEAEFFKTELTPKAAKVSRKGEFKADYNEVLGLIRNVAGMAEATGYDPSTSAFLTVDSAGKYKSVLTGFRGTKSVDDGSVTGRYAKVYGCKFVIDGVEVEPGWTIPDIVRLLWTGADRIGKNAKNLTEILDANTEWSKPDFSEATFEVNGHTVVVSSMSSDD
jgi:hypothetical protein